MSDTPTKPSLITSTGPFKDFTILGHVTAEDFDKEAGKVGACVEEADYNVIYRDTLPELHDLATPKLEELSGLKRGTNDKATAKAQERENAAAAGATPPRAAKKVKDVPESFIVYSERVKANVDEEVWKSIDAAFRSLALSLPVNATPTVRSSGLSKANLEKAKEVLTRSVDKIEEAVAKMLAMVGDYDLTRDAEGKPEEASLARLVGAFIAAQQASV